MDPRLSEDGNQQAATLSFLRRHEIPFVNVDAPQSEHFTVMPSTAETTSSLLAYLRLHGRNESAYVRGRTVADRFDYDYSEAELTEINDRVQALAKTAKEVHVVFNNNRSHYAPKAAQKLIAIAKS